MVEGLARARHASRVRRIAARRAARRLLLRPRLPPPARRQRATAASGVVVNLDVGREIAELPLPGLPHLGSGITLDLAGPPRHGDAPPEGGGRSASSTLEDWKVIKRIDTARPRLLPAQPRDHALCLGRRVRSARTRTSMQVIDKRTLEIVRDAQAGTRARPPRHVEFTRDGRYALVSRLGARRRARRLRRRDLRGGQAPAHAQAVGQVQCLQQDHPLGGHQPLTWPAR